MALVESNIEFDIYEISTKVIDKTDKLALIVNNYVSEHRGIPISNSNAIPFSPLHSLVFLFCNVQLQEYMIAPRMFAHVCGDGPR